MEITQPLHRAMQLTPDQTSTVLGTRERTVAESARSHRPPRRRADRPRRASRTIGSASCRSTPTSSTRRCSRCPWAGGAVVPVNYPLEPREIAFSLDECGVAILLVDDMFLGLVDAIREHYAGLDGGHPRRGQAHRRTGCCRYEPLIADSEPVDDRRRGGADVFGIFYTGGTTGTPKGVTLTHDNMMTSAYGCVATGRVRHALRPPAARRADVPPRRHRSWIGGLLVGSTHVFVPAFTPAGALQTMSEHGVTDVLLVPTMIQMMVDSPGAAEVDVSGVRHIIYGASPMSEALLAARPGRCSRTRRSCRPTA